MGNKIKREVKKNLQKTLNKLYSKVIEKNIKDIFEMPVWLSKNLGINITVYKNFTHMFQDTYRHIFIINIKLLFCEGVEFTEIILSDLHHKNLTILDEALLKERQKNFSENKKYI